MTATRRVCRRQWVFRVPKKKDVKCRDKTAGDYFFLLKQDTIISEYRRRVRDKNLKPFVESKF